MIKGIVNNHKAVTLEQFKNIKFDIIVTSYLPHYETFTKLRDMYQPQARVVCQAGNNWLHAVDWGITKNLMASCAPDPSVPDSVNKVFYHQEFPLDIYRYEDPDRYPAVRRIFSYIRSFVNTFDSSDLFKEDFELFSKLEKLMPNYHFESHGASCRDGVVLGDHKIAKLMRESLFGFHLKRGGDGFGHIIFNWFACGRPPIVKMEYYKNQLASNLMIDGVTCIAIDGLTPEEIKNKIIKYGEPNIYRELCENARKTFDKLVNFDKEFEEIKLFLDRLQ